ncbi:tRNA pseudouridine synthase A [Planctomonas deserti]|uniref:tRNA pseudouridine synthase A n=1 Tax=Planctomonas deserti TaxID=2144185 RepID=UPI000D3A937C|nr:tRNA pseudouridine synthase A [Planctomonas deserti]
MSGENETPDAGSRRFRLDIAYDGTRFNGWSRQPGQRTVQGELEAALASIFKSTPPPPMLAVAGRTDAGVHAVGQVAHLDLTAQQVARLTRPTRGKRPASYVEPAPAEALARRVNGILGASSDVVVTACADAPEGFDARFAAEWRSYEYRIADSAALKDPLQRHRTLWLPGTLDNRAMDTAALGLLGLHDFAAYCKPREGATTIRTLQEFRWTRDADGVLVGRIRADAFCHSMVRALAGGCVAVGEGKLEPDRLAELLAVRARTNEFVVLPARGLTLMRVGYPPVDQLLARTLLTRAKREPDSVAGASAV